MRRHSRTGSRPARGATPWLTSGGPSPRPPSRRRAGRVWNQLRPGWCSPQHAQLWLGSLERHVFPRIGEMPVSEVTTADVVGILAPIWHDKPPTARKLRRRIRPVMAWVVAMDLRPDSPCDRLGSVLGARGNHIRHMRALPHGEVARAIQQVRASNARPVEKLASEFLVLTVTCSGEVRGAVWREIDRDEGVWIIPAPSHEGESRARCPACPSCVGDPRRRVHARSRQSPRVAECGRKTAREHGDIGVAQGSSPDRSCAVERRTFLAGSNPARQLSFQPEAARATHGGNDMR